MTCSLCEATVEIMSEDILMAVRQERAHVEDVPAKFSTDSASCALNQNPTSAARPILTAENLKIIKLKKFNCLKNPMPHLSKGFLRLWQGSHSTLYWVRRLTALDCNLYLSHLPAW